MHTLRKARAFLLRDLLIEVSYGLAFFGQFAGFAVGALTLFFVGRLLSSPAMPMLERYGSDYFSFALVGVAFGAYLTVSLHSFASCVREAQVAGTLEALVVTQTSVPTIVVLSSVYGFAMTTARMALFLALGALMLGLNLSRANLVSAALVLALTIVAFGSLGLLSASFVMVFKRGSPVNWLFGQLSWLLGGVFYPVDVLPGWMQSVALWLPLTYSLEGMRLALLRGASIYELQGTLIPLAAFALIALPVCAACFSYAVRRVRIDGSLNRF